jgi:hypothetical protein
MSVKFNYDKTALKNIADFLVKKNEVRVGILSNQWSDSKSADARDREIGPVELACVHEFGSAKRGIPSRSFFRKTMLNRRDDYIALISRMKSRILKQIADGEGRSVLSKVGAQWVAYVIETFQAQGPGWAPLKAATIRARRPVWTGNWVLNAKGRVVKEKKPSEKILWVTGALANSVNFEVKEG